MNRRAPQGPDGWQIALGAFAACQGFKFLVVTKLFRQFHSYQFLAQQPLSQPVWATILLTYAAASVVLLFRGKPLWRAALAVVGAGMWLYLGTEMLLGSIANNAWTSDAPFELLAGIGCIVAAAQWRRAR